MKTKRYVIGTVINGSVFLAVFMMASYSVDAARAENAAQIKSACLRLEVMCSKAKEKGVFINGRKIGVLPLSSSGNDTIFEEQAIFISPADFGAIATVNKVEIENKPVNLKKPMEKDLFHVRNIFLELTDRCGNKIKSNVHRPIVRSFKTGVIVDNSAEKFKVKDYLYWGAPPSIITLVIPTEKIGYLKQPLFIEKSGELYRDNAPKRWPRLEEVSLPNAKSRTFCTSRLHELSFYPREYILDMLKRYNADTYQIGVAKNTLQWLGKKEKDTSNCWGKLNFLRENGIKIYFMCLDIPAYDRLPEADNYKTYFELIEKWSPHIDGIGMDEWFLSPPALKTDGGEVTEITQQFLDAFAKWAGYSKEDALWAFNNSRTDDPRALKAWTFCEKVQNDFAREFVRVAKSTNPKIQTWISYITRNWNREVTSIDSAIKDFDEILDCQTYWFGRLTDDALNSPLITAALGRGKLLKAEYPDKFLWMGIDPFYTQGKPDGEKRRWGNKFYELTPEEVTPYLALMYAISDGVFIQNGGGGQIFRYRGDSGVSGEDVDKFADVVNLVSRIVPQVKRYKKSDIAYYYDPDADWEIIRRVNRYIGARETHDISIGFLQQFCDVDITKYVGQYDNVIYDGLLLPSKFDYVKQNIYLMFAPEYDERGNKVPEKRLSETLNIKGFGEMGRSFPPSSGLSENGCLDMFQITGIEKGTLVVGKIIEGVAYSYRRASYVENPNDYFTIGSRNQGQNVVVNSLWPSFISQTLAQKTIMKDLDYFGWTKRNCPQVNGVDKMVAVAFREPRTAVVDFGDDAMFKNVRLVMFNGREGVIRNEIIKYERGITIDIPPLNVLVTTGQ